MYAIVDIETSPKRITEIAILLHDGKRVVDKFHSLINPEHFVSPFVSRLTGITDEMLQDAPKFHEVGKRIMEITKDAVFVAHSVHFDYNFIREQFKELGADFYRKKLCTVRLSRKVFPGFSSYSLGNICSDLGIEIKDRHRAMGDAEATVKLFEQVLKNDKENVVETFLKRSSKESALPANLPREVFEKLPEKVGVYYFHDEKGKVIYVGKAINIKKRIRQHFMGSAIKTRNFLEKIFDISFELTGTELIALLHESEEIKRLYPFYNRALKRSTGNYVLADYVDRKGIHRLVTVRNNKNLQPVKSFQNFDAGREFMFAFIEEFELCPKCCGIQTAPKGCFDYQIKKCRGVCASKESVKKYNKRVKYALDMLKYVIPSQMVFGKGRTENEKSVVLIDEGIYKGFGFFDSDIQIMRKEQVEHFLIPKKHNQDVESILGMYFRQKELKIVS